LHYVRTLARGCRVMAMIKGNAYGHGMVTIAENLRDVDGFGVATVEEALALRHAGVIQPIVLLSGFADAHELNILIEHRIGFVLHTQSQCDLLATARWSEPLDVWLKLDTGMHRLGFSCEEIQAVYDTLVERGNINIHWMTHFASANAPETGQFQKQLGEFLMYVGNFEEPKSASNSAAIMLCLDAHLDIVRPGLMLYGVSPLGTPDERLKPVMTFTSRVLALRTVQQGEAVGYGARWCALDVCTIAVVSVGYADGYPQWAPDGTPVLVNGQRATIAGRVSMDTLSIEVSGLDVSVGDSVTLWGAGLPIETVAAAMVASPYALLTGVSARVPREII
jgi:alanine racemase